MTDIDYIWATRSRWEPAFWSKVHKTDGCWLWQAGKDKDGYGKFAINLERRNGRQRQCHTRAHRVGWALANDVWFPANRVAMHSCDTPACVNPVHVNPGTQGENRHDCAIKGRGPTPRGRMRPSDVAKIRELRNSGATYRAIAESLGLGQTAVERAARGKTWATS